MKKLFFLISILFIVVGCSNKEFEVNYNKIQASFKKIKSYTLNLKIDGINNDKHFSETIEIDCSNINYKITMMDSKGKRDLELKSEKDIYVLDNKTYVQNDDGIYEITADDILYNKPSAYLDGLKSISKINLITKEKVGNMTYDVYTVTFAKNEIVNLLKDTSLSDIKIDRKVTGKVYINNQNYVDHVIYNINEITIDATYFGINTPRNISLPNKMENKW